MHTLEDIKRSAEIEASNIDLDWDRLENPTELEMLNALIDKGTSYIPDLEAIYTNLTSGKHITLPDQDTELSFEDVEMYTEEVAQELYAAYLIQSVQETVAQVNRIIALSGQFEA